MHCKEIKYVYAGNVVMKSVIIRLKVTLQQDLSFLSLLCKPILIHIFAFMTNMYCCWPVSESEFESFIWIITSNRLDSCTISYSNKFEIKMMPSMSSTFNCTEKGSKFYTCSWTTVVVSELVNFINFRKVWKSVLHPPAKVVFAHIKVLDWYGFL